MARISQYLGAGRPIAFNPSSEAQIFSRHGTSSDPTASIGRWKQELSAEDRTAFARAFKPFLEAFGYEPDSACEPGQR